MILPNKNEIRKPTKTISGITPVAVMLPPRACEHGTCIYCPSLNVPQSYTPKSPVVMRASEVNYDSYKQVQARIKAFQVMNHPTEKIEIIIMGGTFLQYPKKFQYGFVKKCYDALNGKISKNLLEAQKLNEKAEHRCVALCVETRPDECIKHIKNMRELGVTRIELGVQIPDDEIYKKIKRGHSVKDVVDSTKELKDAGFKIGYHIMPGLPGSNPKKDLILFKKIFSDERFKPDQLKIYPCQVIQGSELEKEYWKKKYKPYTKKQIQDLLIKMMKVVPRYCRVMRIMREIPPEYLVSGTTRIDLRKDVEEILRKHKDKIKEIRFREIGFNQKSINQELKLKTTKYTASKGEEYFLEIVNREDVLFGLLRLRIVDKKAIIRELHVYGQSLEIHEKNKTATQHRGLGKWLMEEAEHIAQSQKIKEISIISGVGVRQYYKNLGYSLKNTYMVKNLKQKNNL
jgi:elongator complex protein 3